MKVFSEPSITGPRSQNTTSTLLWIQLDAHRDFGQSIAVRSWQTCCLYSSWFLVYLITVSGCRAQPRQQKESSIDDVLVERKHVNQKKAQSTMPPSSDGGILLKRGPCTSTDWHLHSSLTTQTSALRSLQNKPDPTMCCWSTYTILLLPSHWDPTYLQTIGLPLLLMEEILVWTLSNRF